MNTEGFWVGSQEPIDSGERGRIVEQMRAGERVELPEWGVMDSNGSNYEKMMARRFLTWGSSDGLGADLGVLTTEQLERFTTKTSERRAMLELAEFHDRYTGGTITPESVGVTEEEAREILRKLTEAYPGLAQWVKG